MTCRYLVSGQVQGVGFRFFTLHTARRLGLTGYVENMVDGRVLVVAQGDMAAMEVFQEALAAGPTYARVAHIERIPLPETEHFAGFCIR